MVEDVLEGCLFPPVAEGSHDACPLPSTQTSSLRFAIQQDELVALREDNSRLKHQIEALGEAEGVPSVVGIRCLGWILSPSLTLISFPLLSCFRCRRWSGRRRRRHLSPRISAPGADGVGECRSRECF